MQKHDVLRPNLVKVSGYKLVILQAEQKPVTLLKTNKKVLHEGSKVY